MTRSFETLRTRVGAMTFALALCWGATGCTDDGGDTMDGETGDSMGETATTTGGDLSHSADIQPIWDANCTTNCHEPGGIYETLDLSGDAYDDLVGVMSGQALSLQFVEAGASDMSYLVNKLRGTQADAGGSGAQMPTGGPALDEATIATVEAWIDAGAMP